MCEISQLVLGMVKGHELLQQLLHRGIGSRTLSLPLSSIIYTLANMDGAFNTFTCGGQVIVALYAHKHIPCRAYRKQLGLSQCTSASGPST